MQVKAPNGKPSSAYGRITSVVHDVEEAYKGYLATRTNWFKESYGDYTRVEVHPRMLDENGEPVPYFMKVNEVTNNGRIILYPASQISRSDNAVLAYPMAKSMIVSDKTSFDGRYECFLHSDGRISVFNPESVIMPSFSFARTEREGINALVNNSMASSVLEVMKNRVQKVFPNMRVVLTDSKGAPAGVKSYIRNGTIYLVQDRLDLDTPMHEVSHVFLDLVRLADPIEFFNLVREAIEFMEQNPSYRKHMRDKYPELSSSDFVMEVLADLIGTKSSVDLYEKIRNGVDFNDVETTWAKVRRVIDRAIKAIKNAFGVVGGKPLEVDVFSSRITIRNMAKVISQAFEKGTPLSKLSTYDLQQLHVAASYDQRDSNFRVKRSEDLFRVLFKDVDIISSMTDEQKANMYIKRMRFSATGSRVVFIGGDMLEFSSEQTDGEIYQTVYKKVQEGNRSSDSGMKDALVEWINEGANNEAFRVKMRKGVHGPADYNDKSMNALKKSMNWHPGMKAARLSQLGKLLGSVGITERVDVPESLIGYDPIVTVDFVVSKDGKKVAAISLYDITPEALSFCDTENQRSSIVKNIVGNVRMGEYSLSNTVGDGRKLLLAMAANKLLSTSGVQVGNIMVTGFNKNSRDESTLKPHWVDMVQVNGDIRKMGEIKDFIESIDDPTLKEIFSGSDLRTNNADYWLMLQSFWDGLSFDSKFERRLLSDRSKLSPREMKRLIRRQLMLRKKMVGKDTYDFEYLLLFNALQQLEAIPTVDGRLNTTEQMSQLRQWVSPAFGIKDDMLQLIRGRITEVGNYVVDKTTEWVKKMDKITETYTKYYDQGLSKHIVDKGSALFEKAFATITVSDTQSNSHTVRVNRILWTKNSKEDEFAGQAVNLPDEIIAANKVIVDRITEMLIDTIYHEHVMHKGDTLKGGAKYTREDARKELFETTCYVPGMIPVMSKSTNDLLFNVGFNASFQKFKEQHSNEEMMFKEMAEKEQQEQNDLDTLSYRFLDQLKADRSSKFGSKEMMESIGLKYDLETGDVVLSDAVKNQMMSTNLDAITRYNVMAGERKIAYEEEIIPMVDGLRAWYTDMTENKGVVLENNLNYLNLFVNGTIFNRSKKTTGGVGGVNLEPTVNMLSTMGGTIALAGNINVGIASSIWNNANMFCEAMAQSLSGKVDFGVTDLNKAYLLFGSDYAKVTELAMRLHMVNMSENDIINHQYRVKTKQSFLSAHTAHWFNWASDMHARAVLMVAQMLHDGTWEAYSLDENGELVYDETKDQRFYKDGVLTDEGRILRDGIKQHMVDTGQLESMEKPMSVGYDYRTMNKLKIVCDKYVIGAYDEKTKARAGATMLGRAFLMFKQFMTSRVDNLISEGMYIEDLGQWVVTKDKDGKSMAAWERRFVEGQLATVVSSIRMIRQYGVMDTMKRLNGTQKQNLARMTAKLAVFMALYMLFNGLVDSDDDDDPDEMGVLQDKRMYRNVKYVYREFFLLSPEVWGEMGAKPFAVTNLMNRLFDERAGGSAIDRISKTFVPGLSTGESIAELFQDKNAK